MAANIQDLIEFNNLCDEFIQGKYILADLKISALLKVIAEQEKIRNIVASCAEKFNFNEAIEKAVVEDEQGNSTLTLPEDDKNVVAFVFGLLYRLDNKKLDLFKFLSNFYHKEGAEAGKEFVNFANAIIVPFKEAINHLYSSRHIVVESEEYQKDYFNKIVSTIEMVARNVDNYRLKMNEKEEFTLLLNALHIASDNNDKKQVFALMIGLDYFTKCNKRAREAYTMLEQCFYN